MKDFRLYAILDKDLAGTRDLADIAGKAICGGVDAVQLRGKQTAVSELVKIGLRLRLLTQKEEVLFIVNDRVDLALALNADGVHLGQDDLPIDIARRLMGRDKIIGISTHSRDEAIEAEQKGADYISVGPIFATPTKPDYPAVGIEIIADVKKSIRIPFVAVGGINPANMEKVIKQGAERIAVVRAIVSAKDVSRAARELKEKLDK